MYCTALLLFIFIHIHSLSHYPIKPVFSNLASENMSVSHYISAFASAFILQNELYIFSNYNCRAGFSRWLP